MSKWYFVLTLILVPHLAWAAQAATPDFCDRPFEAICGEGGADAKARDDRYKTELEAMRRSGLDEVKRKFPKLQEGNPTVEGLGKIKNHKLKDQVMAVYYEALLKAVQSELGSTHLVIQLHFDRVKNRLKRAVQAHAAISREETKDMLEQLDKTEVVDAVDVLLGRTGDHKLRDAVIESCSRDGMEDNAFAEPGAKKNYVIVCPGDYLASIDPTELELPPSESLQAYEVWTLGHEVGHHIDAEDHPILYKKMRSCLAQNHSTELKGPVAKYMSEITADHWGNEELAAYLARYKEAGEEEKFNALKRSMISLCTAEDDGEHPAGKFRIEMLRRNPRIHKVMGCSNPVLSAARREDATCTVHGQGEVVLWSPNNEKPTVPAAFDSN